MREVVLNWTAWRIRDLKTSGNMLSISLDASVCVSVTLMPSQTFSELTWLSLASKKVRPECPVCSQVKSF